MRGFLGAAGEDLVATRLERAGWTIIVRNWRCRSGELDIVGLDGETLVAVEVKVRRASTKEPAEWAVTDRKRQRLLTAFEEFRAAHPEYSEHFCRIDLVAVTVDQRGRILRWSHLRGCISEDG